jgi:threonine synthase
VKYVSTRGGAPELDFSETILNGLALDGGLYLPAQWPQIPAQTIAGFAGKPYVDTALSVISPFVGNCIDQATLKQMIAQSYAAFPHPATVPLVQIGPDEWIAELFHGPTFAFKDIAMQLLARLMDYIISARGSRATIIGATSGDTGGAAIEAFRGSERIDIYILFPKGKVSPVQQRQMTTVRGANVHALAIEGNFDDCQALVKAMFNDHSFRREVNLSGVNSINWARIMAQTVYYFTAAATLGAPRKAVSFTVPTGNFGDIFAGYAAKCMGLPIDRLVIATNRNDILARSLATGRYEVGGVSATLSPSMDIQVSSNFERLLFEKTGRNGEIVSRLMSSLSQSGAFNLPGDCLSAIREDFAAGSCDEEETLQQIASLFRNTGYLADPHTAVALHVASRNPQPSPMITLATAHPAKFPQAVERACGIVPPLPERAGDLMQREEKFATLTNDLNSIQSFIKSHNQG